MIKRLKSIEELLNEFEYDEGIYITRREIFFKDNDIKWMINRNMIATGIFGKNVEIKKISDDRKTFYIKSPPLSNISWGYDSRWFEDVFMIEEDEFKI